LAAVVGFGFVLRLLSFLPVGATIKSVSGHDIRMNGFVGLITLLAVAPALVYRKVDLSFVADKYFQIMVSSLIMAFVLSTAAAVVAKFFGGKKSNVNAKGNTGNVIVDFFNGREFNPYFARADLKLQTFRFSIMGLAVLNVLLVLNSVAKNNGAINPVVALAAAFQVVYALDAMFFEEYYFFSYDAMNTGYGFSLISSYHSFPFLPTLVTQYLIARNPTMAWYYLVAIGLMNAVGYFIFRRTESQRCEAAKDPRSGVNKLLEASHGLWNYVRYPNYLGEILIQWSWVLPAACTAGRTDLLIYYLPVFTTLMILVRCSQQNCRNQKKLGSAWTHYCKRVPSNLIPKVF
jgi:delta14-sterol reductase